MPLTSILKLAENSGLIRSLSESLENKETMSLSGLAGSGKSLVLASVFQKSGQPFLVLASTTTEAETIYQDLVSYLGDEKVKYFPGWEILPWENISPEAEVVSQRIQTLYALHKNKNLICVANVNSLLEKTIPPETLKENFLNLKVGDEIDLIFLAEKLVQLGFKRFPVVEELGNFSVRGGIVDIFLNTTEYPIRLELFGNQIESIRKFSVLSQRSLEKTTSVLILPQREVIMENSDKDERDTDILTQVLKEDAGVEWSALFFKKEQVSLLNHLPSEAIIFLDEPELIFDQLEKYSQQIEQSYQTKCSELDLQAQTNFQKEADILKEKLFAFKRIESQTLATASDFNFQQQETVNYNSNLELLKSGLEEFRNKEFSTVIVCDNVGQKQRLEELLGQAASHVFCDIGLLESGFIFPEINLVVLTDHQIFTRYLHRYKPPKFKEGIALSSYKNLSSGDFVVHIDFGIGKYFGLETLTIDGRKKECLLLYYLNDDKLFVPLEEFNRVQKYVGKDGIPSLTKLGGTVWEKIKAQTKKQIQEIARDLLELYAERKVRPGFAFSPDTVWQKQLEDSFIYQETEDQLKAIADVKADLEKPNPMDRLVCGDVGYGKTEVAIRAAFKAVLDHKQVGVLVPTTILAFQHQNSFSERLRDFPFRVEMLSRFKTKKEQKAILEDLKAGKVDIVIGTHRLLQKDIAFKDLGLVIIDEEHRFGVAAKEKLKQLRHQVDVLNLTATPIPRTMQLSLIGARDLSLINTPPKNRQPIQTEIIYFDENKIKEAISRELLRGGQIYFVHNRIQSIQPVQQMLKDLIPDLKIAVAHGQMPEKELERIMTDFYHQKYNCLLSTAIIESGLDIPSVNTIIINRAEQFGLADLYQLRGRVGRSYHKAYAYLIVPQFSGLNETARKRLKAIQQFTQLGSNFHLALKDLEIRGAGNLLGSRQHGFMEKVGADMYFKLLEETIQELKGEKIVPALEVKIESDLDIYIPNDYITDEQTRIEIYSKLANLETLGQLQELKTELEDRFGPLPPEAEDLLAVTELKILAKERLIEKISVKDKYLTFEFTESKNFTRTELERIAKAISLPLEFYPEKKFKVSVKINVKEDKTRLAEAKNILLKI
ncbi:MAG TPA: transcription-repair coupling factor [candidate division Zixibacteria bacterium]|nr:transcription-repair coupling factor [candidate division Zixibacteria bacterium]